MNILIALFSFVLILLCLFTLLVVMVQKPKGDGGMGAALGGGSMEAAFGAETGSLLQKITIYAVISFFVLTFLLYLGNLSSKESTEAEASESLLNEIADETSAEDPGSGLPSDSALQQIISSTEESADEATTEAVEALGDAAADLADQVDQASSEAEQAVDNAEQTLEESPKP